MTQAGRSDEPPRLDKYELIEEIGHGGMATVWRARDPRLGREVAVKIIHRHLQGSAEVRRRFAAEARAVAKLRHPGIVEVYDVADEGAAEQYLVAELVRGTTLRTWLDEHDPMPPEVVAAIGVSLCEALEHAHGAGVVHRDVKPENVLLELASPGRALAVKLADFGIAKILDAQGVTSTGQVLGSPAHMAPEQIEGASVDGRADVFALGVLLYACMVGHLPFEGANPAQVLRRVLDGRYAHAERERPEVGSSYSRVLDRALANRADDRWPSAAALADALKGELARLGYDAPAALVEAYFADPVAFAKAHRDDVVARLARLGEAARKRGDVVAAAGFLNRALAYVPDDAALGAAVARLTRGRVWRKVGLRVVTGGLLAVAAGGGVWASVTHLRARRATLSADDARPVEIAKRPTDDPLALAPLVPNAAPAPHPPALRVPSMLRRAPADTGVRAVSIVVWPKSAVVSIDGAPPEEVFGTTRSLAVGKHTFAASVRGSNCCEPLVQRVSVLPDDGTGAQRVGLSLQLREARLAVTRAPSGATIRCRPVALAGSVESVFHVRLPEPKLEVTCDFEATGLPRRSTSVRLSAGELVTVGWPGGEP